MATDGDVKQAILDKIVDELDGTNLATNRSQVVRDLAEAYAWIESRHQPHGGGSGAKP